MLHVWAEGDRVELKGVLEEHGSLADAPRPAHTTVVDDVVNEILVIVSA